jgi:ABC-type nickel/cobalt efflux system permease component RcnA
MDAQIQLLTVTAASMGFLHTLAGPDHYLPFIMMSRARGWGRAKTFWITLLSGLGHVLSSVALGFVGIAFGMALARLELIESFRGDMAAWMFTVFGFVYLIWGIHRGIRNRPHTHLHVHDGGVVHEHSHGHIEAHTHVHETKKANITPWVIFTVFVFGPCEPLIPI